MCLTKKKSIKVNGRTITNKDKPFIQDSNSLLNIGGENIHFLLPQFEEIELDKGDMDLEN